MKNPITLSIVVAVAGVFFFLGAITPKSALNLAADDDAAIGAQFVEIIIVQDLSDGFPADSAGLQIGDLPTRVNGEPIESMSDLMNAMEKIEPGESITLDVSRYNAERDRWEGLRFEIDSVPHDWPNPK